MEQINKVNDKPKPNNGVTDKTREELMEAKWESLNLVEKALRSDLTRHPDMPYQEATELSEMSPL